MLDATTALLRHASECHNRDVLNALDGEMQRSMQASGQTFDDGGVDSSLGDRLSDFDMGGKSTAMATASSAPAATSSDDCEEGENIVETFLGSIRGLSGKDSGDEDAYIGIGGLDDDDGTGKGDIAGAHPPCARHLATTIGVQTTVSSATHVMFEGMAGDVGSFNCACGIDQGGNDMGEYGNDEGGIDTVVAYDGVGDTGEGTDGEADNTAEGTVDGLSGFATDLDIGGSSMSGSGVAGKVEGVFAINRCAEHRIRVGDFEMLCMSLLRDMRYELLIADAGDYVSDLSSFVEGFVTQIAQDVDKNMYGRLGAAIQEGINEYEVFHIITNGSIPRGRFGYGEIG